MHAHRRTPSRHWHWFRVGVLALTSALLVPGALPSAVPSAAAATCGTTNLAVNHPATASSTEAAGFPAASAVDGNSGTRWSSAFSDPQWIQVDLGQSYNISHATLNWEAAFGRSYQIQTSPDGNTWTTVFSTTTGDGGIDDIALSGTGRWSRHCRWSRRCSFRERSPGRRQPPPAVPPTWP